MSDILENTGSATLVMNPREQPVNGAYDAYELVPPLSDQET